MPTQRGTEMREFITKAHYPQESISWGELAELTHETQVDKFGFCSCEDTEPHEHPYEDCPKTGE